MFYYKHDDLLHFLELSDRNGIFLSASAPNLKQMAVTDLFISETFQTSGVSGDSLETMQASDNFCHNIPKAIYG